MTELQMGQSASTKDTNHKVLDFAAKTDEHHHCCQLPGNILSADDVLRGACLHLNLLPGNSDGVRLSLLQNPAKSLISAPYMISSNAWNLFKHWTKQVCCNFYMCHTATRVVFTPTCRDVVEQVCIGSIKHANLLHISWQV